MAMRGMIVTSDEKLAARARSLRNHEQLGQYLSTERGWNCRLDEIQAAILRVKFTPQLAEWTAARQAHAWLYDSLLKDLPGIILPRVPPGREHVYYLYTIRLETRAGGNNKTNDRGDEVRSDLVQQRLKARGVASTVYYYPSHCTCSRYTPRWEVSPENCASASAPRAKCLPFPCIPSLVASKSSVLRTKFVQRYYARHSLEARSAAADAP